MDWRSNKNKQDSGCLKNCVGVYVNSYSKTEIREITKKNLKYQDFIQEYKNYKGNFVGE